MANPVIGKTGGAVVPSTTSKLQEIPVEKKGPSNFDRVQDAAAEKRNQAVQMPPPVQQVTETQKKELIGEVRRRMEANPAGDPKQVYGPDLQDTKVKLDKLRPGVQSMGGQIQTRFNEIEGQFQRATASLDKLPGMSDPRSLLKLQIEMYTMTQNIEMVSKAMEQVNSGVKSVMQTQI